MKHLTFEFGQERKEIDWRITLSRNSFPWEAIRFKQYCANLCYKEYLQAVKTKDDFLTKVLHPIDLKPIIKPKTVMRKVSNRSLSNDSNMKEGKSTRARKNVKRFTEIDFSWSKRG